MLNLRERSQMIYYDLANNTKTIKTRIADGLFTKVVINGNKKHFELYNYDELIYATSI